MDIEYIIIVVGDLGGRERVRDEKLPNAYNVCSLGDDYTKSTEKHSEELHPSCEIRP